MIYLLLEQILNFASEAMALIQDGKAFSWCLGAVYNSFKAEEHNDQCSNTKFPAGFTVP